LNDRLQPSSLSISISQTTGITLEVSARFQSNVLLKQFGDAISLFQGVPRVFMPLFWVEQKFVMDTEKSSQIKFALDIPWIGQSVGIVLTLAGIILMSMTHLRRLCCQIRVNTTTPHSKTADTEKGTVIKDYEINPLMSKVNYDVKT
jgi:hypothetical protein